MLSCYSLRRKHSMKGADCMKILCIQHVPFEGPAAIEEWCDSRRISIRSVLASEFFSAPSAAEEFDALLLMGGPMSANDDALPWLGRELNFVKAALGSGKKAIGVCLGAQILARALGAAVTKNPEKEIGWYPVECVSAHPLLPMGAAESVELFHWHGETFAIPVGATHLLRSARCENQAFVWNDQVLALQCHPEATPDSIAALVAESADELFACGIPSDGGDFERPCSVFSSAHVFLYEILQRFLIS